jgi:Mor family transcriptional regulator
VDIVEFLYQLKDRMIPKELLKDKIIQMLVQSGLVNAADYKENVILSLNDWNAEKYAISLAKILGKTSFQKFAF